MSAKAPTTPVVTLAPATRDSSYGDGRLVSAIQWISSEWHWLVIGLIYCLGWYTPFTDDGLVGDGPIRWCWDTWSTIRYACGFQLYVPLAIGIILYNRRGEINHFWKTRVLTFSPGHRLRVGNLIPLGIGCFLLIVADLIQVKGVGVAAMVLITCGIAYRMYGPLMLRGPLLMPFALMVFMIPPPDHVTDVICSIGVDHMLIKASAIALSIIGIHTTVSGEMLNLHGYSVEIVHAVCSGANVIFMSWLALITYHMSRRSELSTTVLALVIAAFVGCVLQVLRNMFIAVSYQNYPEQATWLITALIPTCLLMAIDFFTTILLMRISIGGRLRMPHFVMRSVRVAGRGLDHAAEAPLSGIEKGFSVVGKLWTRSERNIERLFRILTPKKKRRARRDGRRW